MHSYLRIYVAIIGNKFNNTLKVDSLKIITNNYSKKKLTLRKHYYSITLTLMYINDIKSLFNSKSLKVTKHKEKKIKRVKETFPFTLMKMPFIAIISGSKEKEI